MPWEDEDPSTREDASKSKQLDTWERELTQREQGLAEASHELRNTLHGLVLATEVLARQIGTSPSRVTVDRMARSARRAIGIVENLLADNILQSGKLVLGRALVEPAELVLEAVEAHQDAGAAAKVVLSADLTPGLSPVLADRERLLEVFSNLIGNALKFTPAGGTISVGAAPREGQMLFWVADSGNGIPTEALARVFERYWRAKPKGTTGFGLGLSICKGIVEVHGGRIWAESGARGTTLLFTLPVHERREAVDSCVNILVVDDRQENLRALEAILEQPGYRIVRANSGTEALRAALRDEFSVVLLDVEMPEMGGFEVASHLKLIERTKSIPIVFITAHGDDPRQIYQAYSAGAADYLVKPLDPELVRRKVAVFAELGRRRASQDPSRPSGPG